MNTLPIGDSDIPQICKATELERLGIAYTRLTDRGLADLATLRHLKSVMVGGNMITDQGVADFTLARPDVVVIRVGR